MATRKIAHNITGKFRKALLIREAVINESGRGGVKATPLTRSIHPWGDKY
jgi:hypothetical protein